MANRYQRRLGKALRRVRSELGFGSAYDACIAQSCLTYDQYINRESGRAAISVEDVMGLADGWGRSPAELFCLLSEAMQENAFQPIADKLGVSTTEAQRRFKVKQTQSGLRFEQLFLLVLKDQIQL